MLSRIFKQLDEMVFHTRIHSAIIQYFRIHVRPMCRGYSINGNLNLVDKNKNIENKIIEKDLNVIGWVRSVRRHKTRVFFDISDGSAPFSLQVSDCHISFVTSFYTASICV